MHKVQVRAPKGGVNVAVEFTINEWPTGEGQAFVDSATALWGAKEVADNINSIAEQKAQNALRVALNPNAKGEPGMSVTEAQEKLAGPWKLGAVRPRGAGGTRTVSTEAYMASLESKTPEEIEESIKKMKALLNAKKGK